VISRFSPAKKKRQSCMKYELLASFPTMYDIVGNENVSSLPSGYVPRW